MLTMIWKYQLISDDKSKWKCWWRLEKIIIWKYHNPIRFWYFIFHFVICHFFLIWSLFWEWSRQLIWAAFWNIQVLWSKLPAFHLSYLPLGHFPAFVTYSPRLSVLTTLLKGTHWTMGTSEVLSLMMLFQLKRYNRPKKPRFILFLLLTLSQLQTLIGFQTVFQGIRN